MNSRTEFMNVPIFWLEMYSEVNTYISIVYEVMKTW